MTSERLSRSGLYPAEGRRQNIRAQWTGEKRPPRIGEWYLSGAMITAYMAHNDLNHAYHIARLVEVETKQVTTIKRVF